jgi:hypothetical protein
VAEVAEVVEAVEAAEVVKASLPTKVYSYGARSQPTAANQDAPVVKDVEISASQVTTEPQEIEEPNTNNNDVNGNR